MGNLFIYYEELDPSSLRTFAPKIIDMKMYGPFVVQQIIRSLSVQTLLFTDSNKQKLWQAEKKQRIPLMKNTESLRK